MAEEHGDADAWLAMADQDLRVVQILVANNGPAGIACFHCQQAVEKMMKACIAASGGTPPKTHDLSFLADQLAAASVQLAIDRTLLDGLRLYAVAPRYPGFGDSQAEVDLPGLARFASDVRVVVVALLATL